MVKIYLELSHLGEPVIVKLGFKSGAIEIALALKASIRGSVVQPTESVTFYHHFCSVSVTFHLTGVYFLKEKTGLFSVNDDFRFIC